MGKYADLLRQQQQGAFQPQQAPSGFNATYQDMGDTLYDEDLVNDVNYQKASEVIYNMNNSVDAPRLSPQDYAKYGIETMGWFNWNLPKMSLDANRISGATDEQKKAFLYMMESYDDLGISWNGAKRFFKGVATDPTTYVGLTTFGIGLAGKEAAKQTGKQGIKELLKSSTRGGVVAGIESGVYTAVDDVNRQVVETAVSGEDIDLGRVAKSGLIGTGAGFVLGTGITAGVKRYSGQSTREIAETVDEGKLADDLPGTEEVPDIVPRLATEDEYNEAREAATSALKTKIVGVDDVDTRGQGQQYHGTSTELGELDNTFYTELNIYGQGFYTTDALDIAKGYSNKGKGGNPTRYKVIKLKDANLYDLDQPLNNDAIAMLSETTEFNSGWLADMPENPTVRDAFDELRDWSAGEQVPANEVQEMFDSFRYLLEQQGFEGYLHRGGDFTNNKSHQVEIFWKPQEHIRLEKIEDSVVKPLDPEAQQLADDLSGKNGTLAEAKAYNKVVEDELKRRGFDGHDVAGSTKIYDAPEGKVTQTTTQKSLDTAAGLKTALNTVIQAIKRTVPAGKVSSLGADGVQNMGELVQSVEPLKQLLKEAAAENPAELAEYLKKQELTDGQSEFLEVATSQTVSALKVKVFNLRLKQQKLDGDEALAISKQIDEIEEVIAPLDELDAALSTITGQRLRARQESLNTGELRGETISSLQASGLSRTEAERQWDAIFKEKLQKHERTQEMATLNAKIEEVRKSGDTAEYIKLKQQKQVKKDEFAEEVLREEGSSIYRAVNKPIKVLNEIMISFVFSPATLIVNVVPSLAKTVYKPLLNNLMQDGLSATSRKKIVAEYSAMWNMKGAAMNMARAAWRYEKSILTGDSARFLEEYNTIPKRYGGGILRHFPRALLATDAFFENIHYRGYAVGKATGDAMEAGVAKGLKDKELDDFVQIQTQEALTRAYAPEENAIDILMSDGISRGLKGKKLENFINNELAKNESAFVKATDQDGRDYVQDVLFKRDFSGKGAASSLAKGYEGFVNKHPAMRLMGQLFFRTPVRVFEEGIRLTPGLNMISPGFMKDLKGANGPMRQARAQGEALMSYSIAGSVFSLYATGNVTGAMGQDYKQTRQGENAGGQEPYTIMFSDGSTFNYRNFDPFSTPIKIIVNALERAETLAYREEQGESINKSEMEKIQALVAVGVGSIAQSLRDANLASGVDSAMDFFEDLGDPDSSDQLIKFAGRKVQTFLPNTYYKYQMLDNPVLGDPVTMEQFILQRVNPDDPLVPKQYTALGRARTLSNPVANLIYFDTATVEERQRGIPAKEIEVERFLYKLAQVGDTHFTASYKMPKFMGDIDLRTQITKDGMETYYDRWMRYTHESGLIDVLHGMQGLPMGTASQAGIAEQYARKYINQFREMAFMRLFGEEAAIPQEYRSVLERKIQGQTGQRSSDNIIYNIGN